MRASAFRMPPLGRDQSAMFLPLRVNRLVSNLKGVKLIGTQEFIAESVWCLVMIVLWCSFKMEHKIFLSVLREELFKVPF